MYYIPIYIPVLSAKTWEYSGIQLYLSFDTEHRVLMLESPQQICTKNQSLDQKIKKKKKTIN